MPQKNHEQSFAMHPNEDLVRLFRARPYQGQDPALAKVIFLSSDANFSARIAEDGDFFRNHIVPYLKDGVRYWKEQGVHHPFLHSAYPFGNVRGGVRFHRTF